MYSQKTVTRSLDRWIAKGNFTPEYHSVADCERFIRHIETLVQYDPDKKLFIATRDPKKLWKDTLTPEEIQWVRNERLLIRVDYNYFRTRYVWIKNEEDRVVRFTPWVSQEILLDIISEMDEQQFAIMLIILKARQLGLSREISLMLTHRGVTQPNRNIFIASATSGKTGLLFDMVDFVLDRIPPWIRPAEKFRRENELLELHNGSTITLQHGQQTSGIARGTTPTVAHISELSEFDPRNVGDLIDSSLLRAMHDSPDTFLALESTAKGMNNWWHEKWKSAKAGWPVNRSRLRPLFLPWFVGGLYPKLDWLRAHPVPVDYSASMAHWAFAHAEMAGEYVKSTDYLTKRLGSGWQMPIEQIWYYECERDSAIRERRLSEFLQEMPANDDEAFQSSNRSVFDTETIVFYRDHAHREPLEGCYGLSGLIEHVPARLQPPDLLVDKSKPRIPILVETNDSTQPIRFELVPLRFDGWSLEDASSSVDKIYLWEKPIPGEVYGLGVDPADGLDKDRTVIEIIRKAGFRGPTKQVGEFASGRMNALDAWPFALALGTYFSVPDHDGHVAQPRMAIECKGSGGKEMQNVLRMMGWRNFHPWTDRQLDNRYADLSRYTKLGVYTDYSWRAGMIELVVKTMRDCDIEICSPFLVQEMQSLEANDMVQQLRAGYGGHDDRIMAIGFILVSLFRWDADYYKSARVAAYSGIRPVAQEVKKKYADWAYDIAERNTTGIYE